MYFHHPFWGVSLIFGNIQVGAVVNYLDDLKTPITFGEDKLTHFEGCIFSKWVGEKPPTR